MEISFFGNVNDAGELTGISKPAVARGLKNFIGKPVQMIIRNKLKHRSLAQNKVQWWYYTEISAHTGYTKNEVHEICRVLFLKTEKVNEATGTVFELVKSTTELTTVEHMEYSESIRRWAAMEFGINLPEPNEQQTIQL